MNIFDNLLFLVENKIIVIIFGNVQSIIEPWW